MKLNSLKLNPMKRYCPAAVTACLAGACILMSGCSGTDVSASAEESSRAQITDVGESAAGESAAGESAAGTEADRITSAAETAGTTAAAEYLSKTQEAPSAEFSDPAFIVTDAISYADETPHLTKGRDYFFDMDSDGTPETIRYTITREQQESPAAISTLHIFINGREIFTKTDLYDFKGAVYMTDTDKKDSLLEIHCQITVESECMELYNFIRYENETVTDFGNLTGRQVLYGKGSLYRCGETVFNGDGTFTLRADTPVYARTVGSYYIPLTFVLTDGGITEIVNDEYEYSSLLPSAKPYICRSITDFDAYTAVGGTEVSFHAVPGDEIYFKKLHFRDDGTVFALAVNAEGAEGWISAMDVDLFENVPSWG